MTIQEQQFLIALLNLSSKLKMNDTTVIDDIAILNNHPSMTIENQHNIEDIMLMECTEASILNKELLKKTVNSIAFLDQAFLLELVDFILFDRTNTEGYKAYINNAIAKNISFKSQKNEYLFYSRIVNTCIYLRDSTLVKKAIDKLQSIHTTAE